eukprot:3609651-Pyramimonas_sp.AAC.1
MGALRDRARAHMQPPSRACERPATSQAVAQTAPSSSAGSGALASGAPRPCSGPARCSRREIPTA